MAWRAARAALRVGAQASLQSFPRDASGSHLRARKKAKRVKPGRGQAPTERITIMDNKPTTAEEWLDKAIQYGAQG